MLSSILILTACGGGGGGGGGGGSEGDRSGNAANNPPLAVNDTATTQGAKPVIIEVLANDYDANGDTLSVESVTQPANGTVTINNDGSVTYTPNTNTTGTDTFSYTISDGQGGTATATVTVTVTVTVQNNLPKAADDASSPGGDTSFTTNEDTSFTTGNVLANDNLGDPPTTVTTYDRTSVHGGAVVLNTIDVRK